MPSTVNQFAPLGAEESSENRSLRSLVSVLGDDNSQHAADRPSHDTAANEWWSHIRGGSSFDAARERQSLRSLVSVLGDDNAQEAADSGDLSRFVLTLDRP